MKHNFKRFLSLLLALVMVLGMFPMTHAHAEGEAAPAVYQVTEVVDGGEYAFTYAGMRAAYNRVKDNGRLDAGNVSLDDIKSTEGYRWKLEAVGSDGEIEGYRIKGVATPKYLVLHEGTAALVDNADDAQVFTFEYTDAGFMIHDKNAADSYFNNFAGSGNIAGWTGGTGITVYRYEAEHIHNYVDAPAVEPTLNSAGLTAGTVCVCGAVGSGREPIPAKDYNEGIVPLDKIIPTAGNYNTPTHANDGGASYALDNNLSTMWHSNYSGNSGYGDNSDPTTRWIDFAVDGAYDVTGLRYLGRNNNGNITKYTIQVSYDGTSYEDLTTGTWADNGDWKEVKFETPLVNVKNVRLLAVESRNGYVVAVEMRLVGTKHEFAEHVHTEVILDAVAPTIGTDGKTEGKKCSECGEILVAQEVIPALYKSKAVPNSAFTATVGSYETSSDTEGNANLALDDSLSTMWHSAWAGDARENLWFDFELTADYEVTGLYYKPRNGAANGTITKYQVLGSVDGKTWTELTSGTWEVNDSWKEATFEAAKVKHVRLMAVESTCDQNKNVASAAEIRLVGVPCDDHFHRYTVTVTDPTCSNDGNTTYTCSCGYSYTDTIPATGNHTTNDDGDCTTAVVCSGCGQEVVSAKTHAWDDGVHTDPDGETAGYTTYKCTNDGCEETDVVYDEPTEPELPEFTSEKLNNLTGEASSVDTSEANFDKSVSNAFDGDLNTFWATTETGTLAEDFLIANLGGSYLINKVEYTKRFDSGAKYNCTGNLLNYIIEVSNDDGATWTKVAEGNTIDGTTEITFVPVVASKVRLTATQSYHWKEADANKVMTAAEFAVYKAVCVAHNWDEGRVFDPTCGTDGYTLYTCGTCGSTKTEAGDPATGIHNWGEGEVTTPATCTENGVKTFTCSGCGETKTETIPATHDNIIHVEAEDATCTEAGNIEHWYCADCGAFWLDAERTLPTTAEETVISALGHCWERENAGYCATDYYCCKCPATNPNYNTVVYFDNTETEWETVKAVYWFGNEINGWAVSQGEKDGIHTFLIHDDAVGIDFRNGGSGAETIRTRRFEVKKDKIYDAKLIVIYFQENRAWDKIMVMGATDDSYDTILSHSSSKTPKDGKHVLYMDEDASLMLATFYLGDTFVYRCQFDVVEGKTYFYPACDHAYDDGEVTKAPTCTETGIKTFTCSICGETKTESIPATGHVKTTLTGAEEATCGADGYTGDLVCDKCGVTVTPGTAIPATGNHTYDDDYDTDCNVCGDKREVELFKFVGTNMTLGNSLDVNFFIDPAAVAGIEGASAIITKTFADGRPNVVVTVAQKDWLKKTDENGNEYYYVKLADISAKEMTDAITVVVYNAEGKQISETKEDSVRAYAMRLIEKEEAKETPNQENLTLAVDILNYGAAAQSYFSYNVNDLANNKLSGEQKTYATAEAKVENKREYAGKKCIGASLLLENSVQLNFVYKTADIADVAYAKVSFMNHHGNKKEATINRDAFCALDKKGVYTYIPVAETAIADCRVMVTIELYNEADQILDTVVDSVESYCSRAGAAEPLFDAIMKLADSAWEYFH